MSKSNAFENAFLLYFFNNTAIPSLTTTLYLSLHTGDPGEAGDQTTLETAYTNYLRVAVTRSGATGFTVSGNSVSNTALVTFATCGTTGATLTHWGLGLAASAAGTLCYSGALTTPKTIVSGDGVRFNAAALTITED